MTASKILKNLKGTMKVVKEYKKKGDPFGYDFLRLEIGILIAEIEKENK